MSRDICLKPCPTTVSSGPLSRGIKIPMIPGQLKSSGSISLQGGCDGCELVADLMLALNPLLSALGLPLCLLRCLGAVIKAVKAIPDSMGPPPDPTKLIQAITDLVKKCECVVGLALPPPVGPICDFALMIRDLIGILLELTTCILGLLTHLMALSLKATLVLTDEDPSVAKAGLCLAAQVQALMDALCGKIGNLGGLFAAIQPIIELLGDVMPPPFSDVMQELKDGIAAFGGSFQPGGVPSSYLKPLQDFKDVLQSVYDAVNTITAICPQ